jgi:methanogenic corrinoid protein MtbC1
MTALTRDVPDAFVAALLAGDATRARHMVDEALAAGTGPAEIYLELLQPALYEVGRQWEHGEAGIAHEHIATAIAQGLLGALGAGMRVPPRGGRLAILACTPGEQHSLGVQMLGDFLESVGWEVLQLGASLPAEDLVALAADEQPDVVGLSTATPALLGAAQDTVARLRMLRPTPYVVVGGMAWAGAARAQVAGSGADAWLPGPAELLELVARRFPPQPEDRVAGT